MPFTLGGGINRAQHAAIPHLSLAGTWATGNLFLISRFLMNDANPTASAVYVTASSDLVLAATTFPVAPAGCTRVFKFGGTLGTTNNGITVDAQLYNVTTAAAVAGSQITFIGDADQIAYVESGEIVLNLAQVYRIQLRATAVNGVITSGCINVYAKVS